MKNKVVLCPPHKCSLHDHDNKYTLFAPSLVEQRVAQLPSEGCILDSGTPDAKKQASPKLTNGLLKLDPWTTGSILRTKAWVRFINKHPS